MDNLNLSAAFNLLLALLAAYVVLRYLPDLIDWVLDRYFPRIGKEWGYFWVLLATLIVGSALFATGVLVTDDSQRVNELLFTVGAPALIFTFQSWIRDALAGLGLNLYRPMRVGDWIISMGKMGGVTRIGLFRTEMTTLGLDRVSFRNSDLFSTQIRNLSTIPFYEVNTVIHTADYAGYGHNVGQYLSDIEEIALRVQEKVCPEALAFDRLRAKAYLLGFGPQSDEITVISYAAAYRDAVSEMHVAMAEALRPLGVVVGQVTANSIENVVLRR